LRILRIHTAQMPLAADVDLESLAGRTEGYAGADLENLVRRAGLEALREDLEVQEVPMRLFEAALKDTRPSVTPEMEREYRELAAKLKQASVQGPRIGFQPA
jgi:transitional endoplasmic reticulum ATPase